MRFAALSALLAFVPAAAAAQWDEPLPEARGLFAPCLCRGFELPILAAGPTDPAPSPDGATVAIAARGWIWLLDLESGVARRLTDGAELDSRPAWRPDGGALAFLRDDGRSLAIWSLDLASGEEKLVFEDEAIVLDPAWAPDGESLYFQRLHRRRPRHLAALPGDSASRRGSPTGPGSKCGRSRCPAGARLPLQGAVLAGCGRAARRRRDGADARAPSPSPRRRGPAASTGRGCWRSTGRPGDGGDGYRLLLLDPDTADPMELVAARGLPLTPAFTPDGGSVVYVEAGRVRAVRPHGASAPAAGRWQDLPVRAWDFGVPLARVRITTRRAGEASPVPARLEVLDSTGHPAVVPGVFPRSDGTHGRIYFYSPGVVEVEVPAAPAGEVRITATHGFASAPASVAIPVAAGETAEAELVFEPLWDPRAAGYRSGDHHFHLNYGGPTRLSPDDLELLLAAEDLDIGTPLMANLHHRRNDTEFFADRRLDRVPAVLFGQEIRSHFLGHLGLIGIESAFWPWFWGPGYPVYEADDRPNLEALAHSRRQGGVSSYMHPVSRPDPFGSEGGLGSIPISVIPDAVLGDLDSLEVACLWTNEFGTADLWHRVLNLGVPLAASAGTDVMLDYHRTMAVGTTRIYVHTPGPFRLGPYLEALRAGRSFVTTGPLLDFRLEGERPGGAVARGDGEASWTLTLASTGPVEQVDLLVNGAVVETVRGLEGAGVRELGGTLALPPGGWVAVRAHGGEEAWPGMNGSVFAQTSPVWIGEVGSYDEVSADSAARDLLRALDHSEARVRDRYADLPIPRILERFTLARERLREFLVPPGG